MWAPLGLLMIARVVLEASGGGYYSFPSGSMEPTLFRGESGIALPLGGVPDRGDVVTFRQPKNQATYVKRVIGLPGDTIAMVDGVPVLNGRPLGQTPLPPGSVQYRDRSAIPQGARRQPIAENLPGGRSYVVLETHPSPADNRAETQVPPGHVFVLGDNRDNSLDSRFPNMGPIPIENLQGEVWMIVPAIRGSLDASRLFSRVR